MKIQVVIGETLGMCHIVSVLSVRVCIHLVLGTSQCDVFRVRVCIHLVLGTSQCANEHLVLGTSQCDVYRVRVCIHLVLGTSQFSNEHLVLGTSQCANDHLVLGTSRRKASPVSETPRPAIIGNHENRSIQKGLCNNPHPQVSAKPRSKQRERRDNKTGTSIFINK